jgi:hypothetical protein
MRWMVPRSNKSTHHDDLLHALALVESRVDRPEPSSTTGACLTIAVVQLVWFGILAEDPLGPQMPAIVEEAARASAVLDRGR